MKKSSFVILIALYSLGLFPWVARGQTLELDKNLIHHEIINRSDFASRQVEIYWSAPEKPKKKWPAIVYVHGVQDDTRPGAINMVEGGLLKSTVSSGFFAVAMSMPGYGQSSGPADFCGRDSQAALRSVLKYLRGRIDVDAQKIEVSGISCGAIVAAMIAHQEPLAAMVLISGVYDFTDMYEKWLTPDWKLEPDVMKYIRQSVETDGGLKKASAYRSALPFAKRFKMPVLIVAGERDPIVDFKQSSRLAQAVQNNGHPNEFILNPEGEHMVSFDEWARYAAGFLSRVQ